jgi:hypothetical protein
VNLVVELVCAAASSHDGKLSRTRAIELELPVPQALHKLDTIVYSIRFEDLKIEAAAGVG